MTVDRSIIHNSQEVEATRYPSIDEWIKKIWYNPQKGILFGI